MPYIAQRGFTWTNKRYVQGETVKDGDMPQTSIEKHVAAGRVAWKDADPVTDAAARRAEELGVDLADVSGSGEGGRVTVSDVEAAAKEE